MKYSSSAKDIIEKLSEFDCADFENWLIKREISIGGNNVLQYVEEKSRWNTTVVLREDAKIHIGLSNQASLVIKNISNIDIDDIKRWFANSASVAPDHVFAYLDFKSKEVK